MTKSKLLLVLCGSLALPAGLFAQAPVITSIQNPASNILPGLPNYGIAPGAIFSLYGTNFGPAVGAEPSTLPWPTSFSNTTVAVTQGATTVAVPIIYVVNNTAAGYSQFGGIMPSSLVPGNASVVLTYNNVASAAFTTTILANNFGISTLNQTGSGAAVMTYPTSTSPFYAVVTQSNSAIPGNTYTLWGTGLGAAAGGNTDVNVNVYGNVGPQVQIAVGGIQVPTSAIQYFGRSPGAGPGLDQINFTVPAGLSGCQVSLVVQTANTLSNNTTIPIAANGGACSDSIGLPTTTWTPLLALPNGINLSFFSLNQTTATTFPPPATTAVTAVSTKASANFAGFSQSQLASEYQGLFNINVSLGSCVVTIQSSNGNGDNTVYTPLDAGTSLTLTPASGSPITLTSQGTGSYQANGTTAFPIGAYTMTNGAGGAKVGAIDAAFTVPTPVTWTNETALGNSTVTRANGMTFTWTGGATSTGAYVDIQGSAPFGKSSANVLNFECAAPIAAGTFTVPPAVLMALPAGGGGVQLSTSFGQVVTVPGMNLGAVSATSTSSTLLTWK